jgi:hypothetical protein
VFFVLWNTATRQSLSSFVITATETNWGLLGQLLTRADDSSIEVDHCHVRSKKSQVAHIESQLGTLVEGIKDLLMCRGNSISTA